MTKKAMEIVEGVVGLLILVYVLQATLPLLFALDFTNVSTWGSFASAVLPVVFGIILGAGILIMLIKHVTDFTGAGKGKGKSGYGL